MPRKMLVTGGDDAQVQFVEHAADNEFELQTVLLNHPQLLPAEDLGVDDDLLIVGRETVVASGSVDLLCLSRTGEVVIVEFKTGPQNPDFRHALAQLIDYGSDLWKLGDWTEFDDGVVHRYLASNHVDPKFSTAVGLRDAAQIAWSLDEQEWSSLVARLDQTLRTGDFLFVVAAQRFTQQMRDSVAYLNETSHYGRYFLVELIRLDGSGRRAYAAQVVERPFIRSAGAGAVVKASETDFLTAIDDPDYREAVSQLFSTVRALGLALVWYRKGASIRLTSPDRTEPLSVGWVFLDGGQWYTARHVTLGVDPASLASHPTLATAIRAYCDELGRVPGGRAAPGKLDAVIFEPREFTAARARTFDLLTDLKTAVDAARPAVLSA